MRVEALIQTLNTLIDEEDFVLAEQIVLQHPQHHKNIAFNDAYATVLYFLERYHDALSILNFNIKYIEQLTNDKADWLVSTYFQKANCYYALNETQKAQYYVNKCLRLSVNNLELQLQFHQLLNL